MLNEVKELANKLINIGTLPFEELVLLIENFSGVKEVIQKEAICIQHKVFGNVVYTRGLIEFTNYCKNDCLYCGIRRSNKNAERYRLTKEEILVCCRKGYTLGFRTFVLQGGEDSFFTDDFIASVIRSIKEEFPDCAVTLSVGEKSFETYKLWREAGADRYLLRHETADKELYEDLHPKELSFENRIQCLCNLKKLGYQTGAGFMVGVPGQTIKHIAKDLLFLKELNPEMIGIGPFIPHKDTPLAKFPPGSKELTLFLLSVIRIMVPNTLLPATTALGSVSSNGREMGILAGANVIMPNLSPSDVRGKYTLYNNKLFTGAESAEGCKELSDKINAIGYKIKSCRGDAPAVLKEKQVKS